MDIKSLINLFRARLFNIKLFGNLRIGLYREISIEELIEFITDFRNFCQSRNVQIEETGTKLPFPVNSNFSILERLCEQYYVYEDTDKFQKKIIQEVSEIIDELISVMLKKNKSVVYNRVSRLKAKIK